MKPMKKNHYSPDYIRAWHHVDLLTMKNKQRTSPFLYCFLFLHRFMMHNTDLCIIFHFTDW